MPSYVIRQLMADEHSLQSFIRNATPPKTKEILSNLCLKEHECDNSRPNYFNKGNIDYYLPNAKTLSDIIIGIFEQICNDNLELNSGVIRVKPERFAIWQDIITRISPLFIQSYLLYKEYGAVNLSDSIYIYDYVNNNIKHSFYPSIIPSTSNTRIDNIFSNNGGVCDLHQHLNGTTEADHVWIYNLENPHKFKKELNEHHDFFEQLESGLTKKSLCKRLYWAILARKILTKQLMCEKTNYTELTNKLKRDQYSIPNGHADHHLYNKLKKTVQKNNWDSYIYEVIFLINSFDKLTKINETHIDKSKFAETFYFYLLVSGSFYKIATQQIEQYGFEQFAYIADSKIRDACENSYKRRFAQIKPQSSLTECRFSPKDTAVKNYNMFYNILYGYTNADIHGKQITNKEQLRKIAKKNKRLRLAAHFIKKDDKRKSYGLRHYHLRHELENKAKKLISLKNIDKAFSSVIAGIDAAGNELSAPPEVFAPVYRFVTRHGINGLTYHVGEDYHHLVSGIRAIYEANTFLNLKNGDRIGHGTACGISPELWLERYSGQKNIPISQGEWLDNLIFIYNSIPDHISSIHTKIERDIQELSKKIYKENYTNSDLIRAYEFRYLDPYIAINNTNRANKLRNKDRAEWEYVDECKKQNETAFEIFEAYHSINTLSEYNKKIMINGDYLTKEQLLALQRFVLRKLKYKDIAIEVPLTSNLRISFYKNYKEHHIWRWLGIACDDYKDVAPSLCLATDDPGIFCTNLKNEYIHAYQTLTNDFSKSHEEAADILNKLAQNSQTFAFK